MTKEHRAEYVYSTIQYVPDIIRDECINIGVIVGSDETSEWKIHAIPDTRRARTFGSPRTLDEALSVLREISDHLERFGQPSDIIQHQPILIEADDDYLKHERVAPSLTWLNDLHELYQHIVRITRPISLTAFSIDEAVSRVATRKLLDTSPREHHKSSRQRMSRSLKRAYRDAYIGSKNLCERVELSTASHKEHFDFAIIDESLLQLCYLWSFVGAPPKKTPVSIQSWAWVVQSMRDVGGSIAAADGRKWAVGEDVDVAVAFLPPTNEVETDIFKVGESVFRALEITYRPLENVGEIATRAYGLLAQSGRPPLPYV